MALKRTDTVLNDLPSTGNSELDKFLNDMAEFGLAGLEGHNWQGYASAPVLPLKHWQPMARKVMTVETAVLIIHLCHIHAMHRTFIISALDTYRGAVAKVKEWAEKKAARTIIGRLVPITALLNIFTVLFNTMDESEKYRQMQLKIRRQSLAGRQDVLENTLRFGKPQHPRTTATVSTRNP